MKKEQEMMKYAGSMQQLAYVRPITWQEGRASGMKGWEVKNGQMNFQVMADKCLDVSSLSYRGINMTFLSKPGLQGRNHYDTNGQEAIHSIMGGLFFTSGLDNICSPCTIDGTDYPMHGRIRTTPAEHLCADASWEEESYRIRVSGEMREAALFGENTVLRRSISTAYGEKTITVTDEIENESYQDSTMMILYHINLGYPFLDENLRLLIPTRSVTPRDDAAKGHEGGYDRMDPPKDNEPEYVFIHDLITDENGDAQILAVNDSLGLGLKISYNTKYLPYFMEWKSIASGDYVIGLEPANSSVYGRPWHEERGSVHQLKPFAKETNELRFTILDGRDELDAAETAFNKKFYS